MNLSEEDFTELDENDFKEVIQSEVTEAAQLNESDFQELEEADFSEIEEEAETTTPMSQSMKGETQDGSSPMSQAMIKDGFTPGEAMPLKELALGEGEDYDNPSNTIAYNAPKKLVNRSNELLANGLEGLGRWIDEGSQLIGGEADGEIKKGLYSLSKWVDKDRFATEDVHSTESIKEAFKKGGLFDIDTIQQALNFSAEQGIQSVADMAHITASLPQYIVSRGQEMAETRMEEKGRKGVEPTNEDMVIGIMGATVSSLLEKVGLKATTSDVLTELTKKLGGKTFKEATAIIGKAVGKGILVESGTELVQEGAIEPTTERIGIDTDKPLIDIERGLFGALAGGVSGGAISTVTATGGVIADEYAVKVRQKAMRNYALSFDWTSLTPEQQQIKRQLKNMEFTSLTPELQKQREDLKGMYFSSLSPQQMEDVQQEDIRVAKIQENFRSLLDQYEDVNFPEEILSDVDLQERIIKEYENLEAQAEEALRGANYTDQVLEDKKTAQEEEAAIEEIDNFFLKQGDKKKIPMHIQDQMEQNEKINDEDLQKKANQDLFKSKKLESERKYEGMNKEELAAIEENLFTEVEEGLNKSEQYELDRINEKTEDELTDEEVWRKEDLEAKEAGTAPEEVAAVVPESIPTPEPTPTLETEEAFKAAKKTKKIEKDKKTFEKLKKELVKIHSNPASTHNDKVGIKNKLYNLDNAIKIAEKRDTNSDELTKEIEELTKEKPAEINENNAHTFDKEVQVKFWTELRNEERSKYAYDEAKDKKYTAAIDALTKPKPVIVDEILSPQLEADNIVDEYAGTEKKIGYKKDPKKEGYEEAVVVGGSAKVGHVSIRLPGGIRRDVKTSSLTQIEKDSNENIDTGTPKADTNAPSGEAVQPSTVTEDAAGENTPGSEADRNEEVNEEIKFIDEGREDGAASPSDNWEKQHYVKTDGYSVEDIAHETPSVVVAKFIQKDLSKFAKELIELSGLNPEHKKPFNGVRVNLPPAGGEASFTLWDNEYKYGARFDLKIDPDYNENGYDNYAIRGQVAINLVDNNNKQIRIITYVNMAIHPYFPENQPYSTKDIAAEIKKDVAMGQAEVDHRIKLDAEIAAIKEQGQAKDKPFGELDLEYVEAAKAVSGHPDLVVNGQVGQWVELPSPAQAKYGKYGQLTGEFDMGYDTVEVKVSKSPDGDLIANVPTFTTSRVATIKQAKTLNVQRWLKKLGYNKEEAKGAKDETNSAAGEHVKDPILTDGTQAVPDTGRDQGQSRSDGGRVEDVATTEQADTTTDSGSKRDSDLTTPSGVEENPFILEQQTAVASGEVSRFNDNIKAITLLKENKSRYTLEEKKTLSRYTGWGGLQKAFEQPKGGYAAKWEDKARKLRSILTEEEYKEAKSGVLDAYFTPIETVRSMWNISEHLGFNGGMVLEPSMGTGRFIALTPDQYKSNTSFNGVELDPTTYKIATALYKVNGRNKGFQDTEYKDAHELVIGNPPYAKQIKIVDKQDKGLNGLTIHDYFVAKSIDSLKDGGVLNFVITSSFMDSMTNKAKDEINKRAKLIGAIRLPNNVFASAGTKVTTDIVIFQKLQNGEKGNIEEWGEVGQLNDAKINQYFINNPAMLLGEWKKGYRGGELNATPGEIGEKIAAATKLLPSDIMNKNAKVTKQADVSGADGAMPPSVIYEKNGAYYVNIKTGEALEPMLIKGKADRIKGILTIRDFTNKVIDMQLNPEITDKELEKNRKALNFAYDTFFKKFGYLNSVTNRGIAVKDKSGYTLLGLEENYQRTISAKVAEKDGVAPQAERADKADILTKRTIKPMEEVKTENAAEALILSVYRKGIVDLAYMQTVTGKDQATLVKELKGKIFKDNKQGYVTRDVFLSGDVKTKLEETIDPDAIKELKKVIPVDKEAHEIQADIGSSWISPALHEKYMSDKLGYRRPRLSYNRITSKWAVPKENNSYDFPFNGPVSNEEILNSALNNKKIIVRRSEGTGAAKKTYVDEGATALANAKVDELREDFATWIFAEEERRNKLVPLYNDLYNRFVKIDAADKVQEYKIPNLKFFVPREHQTKAVYRAVFGDNPLLLNHTVGSGKTLTAQMIAMEWRRLGKANKPLIVALKSTVEQFTREFKEAYPNAKVLLPNDTDFTKNNRKRFLSSIATGDYDAIVLSHEQLQKLENPFELQKQLIEDEIAQAEEALLDAKSESDRFTVRDLETAIEKLEARYEKLTSTDKDTDVLSFEKLGIDGMIVDESHQFKKLAYSTAMGSIKGMPSTDGSLRAFDLYVKTKAILKKNNNLVFMTGTPVTNTLPELFLIQKYLQEDTLNEQGLNQFDAWAKNYADPITDIEMTPTGGFKEVTRMKAFKNIPMLMETAGQIIDTVTNADIKKSDKNFKLPELDGGGPKTIFIEPSAAQLEYTKTLIKRLETVNEKENPDNHLAIFGDAVKMAMDMRLLSPGYEDEANSKVNKVVSEALAKYKAFSKEKGTQLIFSDIGTPKGGGKAKAELEELMAKAEGGDTEAQKSIMKDYSDAEIQDILEGSAFSIYEDIRSKLIKGGIPAKEIAFIHDFGTKPKKDELSKKVNSGEIRFVLGSTKKLGTGMNVQKKLVAVHHIDIPYTPAELEQRNGRIIRQGNTILAANPDFKADVFYYATKQTLDGVKWQILENKSKFIQDFMSGVASEIEVEEESNSELAERMKAEASGNPFLIDKIKADKKVKKLKAMKRGFDTNQLVQKSKLKQYQFDVTSLPNTIKNYEADIKEIENNEVKINGKTFEKTSEMGEAVYKILDKYVQQKGTKPKEVGTVGNITITITHDQDSGTSKIFFNGKITRNIFIDFFKQKPDGLGTRINNELGRYRDSQFRAEQQLEDAKDNISGIEKQLKQEFNKWEDLKAAKRDQAEAIDKIAEAAKEPEPKQQPEDEITDMEEIIDTDQELTLEQKHELKALSIEGGNPVISLKNTVLVNNKGKNVAGQYNNKTNEIYISKGYHGSYRVIKHELIHAIYNKIILNNKRINTQLIGLTEEVRKGFEKKGIDTRDYYGMDDTIEFLPEFFSNPEFRAEIDALEYKPKENKTMLDKIIEFFKAVVGKKNKTVTDAVFELLDEMKTAAAAGDITATTDMELPGGNMRPAFINLGTIANTPFEITELVNKGKNKLDNFVFNAVTGKIKGTKFDTFMRKYAGGSMAGLGSLSRGQETDFVGHFRNLQRKLAKADLSAEAKAEILEESQGTINQELFETLSIQYLENPEAREDIAEVYPELAEGLDIVRDYIDRLSQESMERGIILPSQFEKWEGRYLSRLYLATQKPEVAASVSSGIRMYEVKKNRKIDSIIDYLAENPEEAERLGAILDPALMIKQTIAKTQGNLGLEEFFRGITERSHIIDQDMMIAFTDRVANLPMMFSPDYAENTAKPYIEDMINRLDEAQDADEIAFLIERLEEIEDQAQAARDSIQNNSEGLDILPADRRYGAIAGLPMTADVASLVKSQFHVVSDPVMLKEKIDHAGKKLLVYFKWAKVPANIFAYPRNFQSNFFQWSMSGADPAQFFKEYAQAAFEMRTKGRWYKIAQEGGVLQTNMISMEVNDALRQIAAELPSDSTKKGAILKIMEKVGNAYGVIDDVAKIARIKYAIEKEGMSEEEAVNKAQDTHYDYALTYDLIRGMRDPDMTKGAWLKLIGTLFPTYTHKTIAYVYDTIIHRPVTLAMIAGTLLSLVGGNDDDRDKIGHAKYDRIMDDMPEWMENNPLIRVDMEKRGSEVDVTFTDISYVVPFGSLLTAVNSALHGDPVGALSTMGMAGTPVHMIGGLLTNTDSFSGKEIYYEHDSYEKYKDISGYVVKQFAPGTLTKLYSLSETRHPLIPRWVGINTYVYEAKELSGRKQWSAKRAKSDATKRTFIYKRKISQARKDMKQGKIDAETYYNIREKNLAEIKRWKLIGQEAYKTKK